MAKVTFYSNVNGHETSGTKIIPDNQLWNSAMNSIFGREDGLCSFFDLPDTFSPVRALLDMTPKADTGFPKAMQYVTPDDKVWHLRINAEGIVEGEYQVDYDDGLITVSFDHKPTEEDEILYKYKYKTISNEKRSFEIDPRTWDIDTAVIDLKNGSLTITVQPREEVKPVKKTLAGKIRVTEEEESKTKSKKK